MKMLHKTLPRFLSRQEQLLGRLLPALPLVAGLVINESTTLFAQSSMPTLPPLSKDDTNQVRPLLSPEDLQHLEERRAARKARNDTVAAQLDQEVSAPRRTVPNVFEFTGPRNGEAELRELQNKYIPQWITGGLQGLRPPEVPADLAPREYTWRDYIPTDEEVEKYQTNNISNDGKTRSQQLPQPQSRQQQNPPAQNTRSVDTTIRNVTPTKSSEPHKVTQPPKKSYKDGALGEDVGGRYVSPNQSANPIYLMLGVDNNQESTIKTAERLEKRTGRRVVPIFNHTDGKIWDIGHAIHDRFLPAYLAWEPSAETLSLKIDERIHKGLPIEIIAHSQGTVNTANAIEIVRLQLNKEVEMKFISERDKIAMLSMIHVYSVGGFVSNASYPDGVRVTRLDNSGDIVAVFGGNEKANLLEIPDYLDITKQHNFDKGYGDQVEGVVSGYTPKYQQPAAPKKP